MMRMGRGQLSGQAATTGTLAKTLSDQIGRTVIDKTGLTGEFDFKLEWTPDPGQMNSMTPPPGPPGAPQANPPDVSGPSLFTAVQEQLGLKLESARGSVDVLVIEHVDRPTPD